MTSQGSTETPRSDDVIYGRPLKYSCSPHHLHHRCIIISNILQKIGELASISLPTLANLPGFIPAPATSVVAVSFRFGQQIMGGSQHGANMGKISSYSPVFEGNVPNQKYQNFNVAALPESQYTR